jgi:hypothetical protein
MQELDDYKLEGYDCTLGSYPSPLIPIISRNSEYQAVYFDDNFQLQLRRIDAIDSDTTAKFSYLSNCYEDIKNKLEKFDYRKHKLFAKDENNVEFYEVEDETYFFVKFLIDKSFSKDNPFVRVSYAKATGIKDLVDREKENYEQYLNEYSKNREKKFWEKYKNFTVEDTTLSLLLKIPVTGEKASEVGADYTILRDLLQNKNFEEADKETETIIRERKLQNLTKDWHTIDKLWAIGSGGKTDLKLRDLEKGSEEVRRGDLKKQISVIGVRGDSIKLLRMIVRGKNKGTDSIIGWELEKKGGRIVKRDTADQIDTTEDKQIIKKD